MANPIKRIGSAFMNATKKRNAQKKLNKLFDNSVHNPNRKKKKR